MKNQNKIKNTKMRVVARQKKEKRKKNAGQQK